ncbi:MAG: stage 0 sporulation family protein [Clostridiales bacterium]|nr:stage 0 sporulation family protein [Clostridiales bacterium]
MNEQDRAVDWSEEELAEDFIEEPGFPVCAVREEDITDEEPDWPGTRGDDHVLLVGVRLHGRGKIYHFSPADYTIRRGDYVIVETSQGIEMGVAADWPQYLPKNSLKSPLKKILRLASNDDLMHYEENKLLEEEALVTAKERVQHYGLDMTLIDVEYRFDNRKITFFFTADGRVDFRELVRDLASLFRTRIELRQIGVRDEACMIGGLGICGRELCCSTFLHEFKPVSIRMAKDQNLSMNPSKISGTCGRLLCCLNYEHHVYTEAKKKMPAKNARVTTPEGVGTVEDVDLLRETVTVRLERENEKSIVTYPLSEITR